MLWVLAHGKFIHTVFVNLVSTLFISFVNDTIAEDMTTNVTFESIVVKRFG